MGSAADCDLVQGSGHHGSLPSVVPPVPPSVASHFGPSRLGPEARSAPRPMFCEACGSKDSSMIAPTLLLDSVPLHLRESPVGLAVLPPILYCPIATLELATPPVLGE